MNRLFLFISVLLATCDSIACTCIGNKKIKPEFISTQKVFDGLVISIDSVYRNPFNVNEVTELNVKFIIIHSYKGENKFDTTTITTYPESNTCSYKFIIGKRYIVFSNKVYRSNDQFLYWGTSKCLPNRKYNVMDHFKLQFFKFIY